MTYKPKGRTDESSYDYTDDPRELSWRFSRERLQEALAEASTDGVTQLKFDYEEWVPAEAVREALAL